jgi:hypothetical protein
MNINHGPREPDLGDPDTSVRLRKEISPKSLPPPPRYRRWTLCKPRLSRKVIDLATQPNSSLSQVYYRQPYFHLFGCCGSFGRRPSEVPPREWEEKQAIEAKGEEWWRDR